VGPPARTSTSLGNAREDDLTPKGNGQEECGGWRPQGGRIPGWGHVAEDSRVTIIPFAGERELPARSSADRRIQDSQGLCPAPPKRPRVNSSLGLSLREPFVEGHLRHCAGLDVLGLKVERRQIALPALVENRAVTDIQL
jgi:hypothetical protein